MKGESRTLHGFSLVELLVVMAIISLLAGLLLPVLEEAIGTAYTVKCINNLRQIGMGHHLYADDYDGVIPRIDCIRNAKLLHILGHLEVEDVPGSQTMDNVWVNSGWFPNRWHYPVVWDCPAKENNGYQYTQNLHYPTYYRLSSPPPAAWGMEVFTVWADHKSTGDSNWSWNSYERGSALLFPHAGGAGNWLYIDNRVRTYKWPVPGLSLEFSFSQQVEAGE